MQEIANALAKGTLRGELSAYWWLALNGVSYTGLEEASKANTDNLYSARLHPYPAIQPYLTASRLTWRRYKELSQQLADLFNLMLPVS